MGDRNNKLCIVSDAQTHIDALASQRCPIRQTGSSLSSAPEVGGVGEAGRSRMLTGAAAAAGSVERVKRVGAKDRAALLHGCLQAVLLGN